MSKEFITGIDIGSSKITTVIVSTDDKQPKVIGVSTNKSSGIKKGVVVDIDDAVKCISESIESAERMSGVTITSAVLNIGGKQISSTNNHGVIAISKDDISKDDVERVIESSRAISVPQTKEILHVIPREFIVDSQDGIRDPIGMSGIRLEVDTHIITVSSMALHNLIKCVNQVGIAVDSVVFSGLADGELLLNSTEKELGVMLIDIGFGICNVVLYMDDAITFSSTIPIGSNNITNDIAIGLRLSIEDAEKVKNNIALLVKKAKISLDKDKQDKKYSPDNKLNDFKSDSDLILKLSDIGIEVDSGVEDIKKSMLDDIIDARLEEIFSAIKEDIKKSGFDYNMPSGVVLTGGGAMLDGIGKSASKYLSSAVRVAHPSNLIGLTDEISTPAYSTVCGLIDYYLNKNKLSDNSRKKPNVASFANKGNVFLDWLKTLMP
ncbi:cell division protein FtsA [Patescibacteria group bacterium]|nr:cell division protein FtsA [Patescibacteria group bacterium]